jgi:hypothetical protein
VNANYIQYLLDPYSETWSEWMLFEINALKTLVLPYPTKIRCVDVGSENTLKKAYWCILNEKGLYHAEYNPRLKTAVKAVLIGEESSGFIGLENLTDNLDGFNESEYQAMCNSFKKRRRNLDDILTLRELETTLIRPADEPLVMNLAEDTNDAVSRALAFQKRSSEVYIKKVKSELVQLVTEHTNYESLKQAVLNYLSSHWQRIKGSHLTYTALPNHPVTQLLTELAIRLGEIEDKSAISLLMPDIYTISLHNNFFDLDKLELTTLLKTHILDSSQQYLLPISLALEDTAIDKISPLKNSKGLMNPYYDFNDTHDFLCSMDLTRLYQHSSFTRVLNDDYIRYQTLLMDDGCLVGQLNTLIRLLRLYGAHGGIGQQGDANVGAYDGIDKFMTYYRSINPVGIIREAKFTDEISLKDRNLSYVLVPDGLYFINRHNNSSTKICDSQKTRRYPVDLLYVNTLSETHLHNELNKEHPTLIKVNDTNAYYIYGKKISGWQFTLSELNFPPQFPSRKNHIVTLNLGNVPEALYQEIEQKNAHVAEDISVLEYLMGKYPKGCHTCTPEQLSDIETHTGHAYLLEFAQVPETIRNEIHLLWNFVHNPSKNLRGVLNLATCIGTRSEVLQEEIQKYTEELSDIHWDKALIEESKQYVIEDQEALQTSLYDNTYEGVDFLAPTPEILNYLDLPLDIQNTSDLIWLYTFPASTLERFLNDPSNKNPKTVLQNESDSLENIILLLTDAPTQVFEPLLNAIKPQIKKHIKTHIALNYLFSPLTPEKCTEAFRVLMTIEPELIIRSAGAFNVVLKHLSPEQCTAIYDVLSNELPTFIQSLSNFIQVLEYLSPKQCESICNVLKQQHPRLFIQSAVGFSRHFKGLTSGQCAVICDALGDELLTLIRSASDFNYILACVDPARRIVIYEALEDKLLTFIQSAKDFQYILEYLDTDRRIIIYEAFGDEVLAFIQSAEDFDSILKYLDPSQYLVIYDALGDELLTFIQSGHHFKLVLPYITPEQCKSICDALKKKNSKFFLPLANNWFRNVARDCAVDKRTIIYEALKEYLSVFIKSSENFQDFLQCLSSEQRTEAFFKYIASEREIDYFIPHSYSHGGKYLTLERNKEAYNLLLEHIKSSRRVSFSYNYLSITQERIISEVGKKLSSHFESAKSAVPFLRYLTPEPFKIVCQAYKDKLIEILSERLTAGLSYEDDMLYVFNMFLGGYLPEQCKIFCEIFYSHLTMIVKSARIFKNALQYRGPEQRTVVYEILSNTLPTLMQSIDDCNAILCYLTPEQCKEVFKWQTVIQSAQDFERVMQYLALDKRTAAYEEMYNKFPGFIQSAQDFESVVQYLTTDQRTAIYEELEDKLPTLIKSAQDFKRVVQYLTPEQRTSVYEAPQYTLRTLIQSAEDFKCVLQYLKLEQRTAVYGVTVKCGVWH